jgi:hypothetical protein
LKAAGGHARVGHGFSSPHRCAEFTSRNAHSLRTDWLQPAPYLKSSLPAAGDAMRAGWFVSDSE